MVIGSVFHTRVTVKENDVWLFTSLMMKLRVSYIHLFLSLSMKSTFEAFYSQYGAIHHIYIFVLYTTYIDQIIVIVVVVIIIVFQNELVLNPVKWNGMDVDAASEATSGDQNQFQSILVM